MITRIWHGRTSIENAESYLTFLLEKGVQDYLHTPGNLEVRIWRNTENGVAHFWTVSRWADWQSIAAFAGEDINKARYYPEDHHFLLEFEPAVQHVETFIVK
jgi:heme-degrading monooxygenase HmoA